MEYARPYALVENPDRVTKPYENYVDQIRYQEALRQVALLNPDIITVLSDNVEVDADEGRIEPTITGNDRLRAVSRVAHAYPKSRILTLSTSPNNQTNISDASVYHSKLILWQGIAVDRLLTPQDTSYDTFTELIQTLHVMLVSNLHRNLVITGIKQYERTLVMLDTLRRFAIDEYEMKRLAHYFTKYMPQRIRTSHPDLEEAFDYYADYAMPMLADHFEDLKDLEILVLPSEDITLNQISSQADHVQNLEGVADWLNCEYGRRP